MPQQFQAVKCYKCNTFQVQQVKKVQKFSCAVCGEKQTIQRIYAISNAAKDIRLHIQRLNMGNAAAEEVDEDAALQRFEDSHDHVTDPAAHGLEQATDTRHRAQPDWTAFNEPVEDAGPDSCDDDAGIVTVLPDRKRGRALGAADRRSHKQRRVKDGEDLVGDDPLSQQPASPSRHQTHGQAAGNPVRGFTRPQQHQRQQRQQEAFQPTIGHTAVWGSANCQPQQPAPAPLPRHPSAAGASHGSYRPGLGRADLGRPQDQRGPHDPHPGLRLRAGTPGPQEPKWAGSDSGAGTGLGCISSRPQQTQPSDWGVPADAHRQQHQGVRHQPHQAAPLGGNGYPLRSHADHLHAANRLSVFGAATPAPGPVRPLSQPAGWGGAAAGVTGTVPPGAAAAAAGRPAAHGGGRDCWVSPAAPERSTCAAVSLGVPGPCPAGVDRMSVPAQAPQHRATGGQLAESWQGSGGSLGTGGLVAPTVLAPSWSQQRPHGDQPKGPRQQTAGGGGSKWGAFVEDSEADWGGRDEHCGEEAGFVTCL